MCAHVFTSETFVLRRGVKGSEEKKRMSAISLSRSLQVASLSDRSVESVKR